MERNLSFLFSAAFVVWIVIFGYVFSLIKKNKELKRDIELIKENLKK